MLVEDTTAFVEQLEVLANTKTTRRHRRRLAHAELELLEAHRDVQMAASAIAALESMFARSDSATVGEGRRLLRERRAGSLQRELDAVRRHWETKREEVAARRQRLDRLQRETSKKDARRGDVAFRLHSSEHCLDCSERRFARLSVAQLVRPVLVAKTRRRRWWWYRNRFWWDYEGLSAREVETLVLHTDLHRKQQADVLQEARVAVLGPAGIRSTTTSIPTHVQSAVWSRDGGRCVDCGSGEGVSFDSIIRNPGIGDDAVRNVELRCHACRERRGHNEARARVSSARFDALPYERPPRERSQGLTT